MPSLKDRLAGMVIAARGVTPPRPLPADLEREPEFVELQRRCAPFTMTSYERQYALFTAVRHLHRTGVAGAFVECGVWRGGSSILAALTLQRLGAAGRELYLYDTFAGMTEPTAEDGVDVHRRWAERQSDSHNSWAYSSRDEVERNLQESGVDMAQVRLVEGPVEETIPGVAPERVALLRLDTDWYDSTRHELVHLYDRVEPGGIVLIDDYGHWQGARRAVDEFFADRDEAVLLMRIDRAGRLVQKPPRP